MFGTKTESVKRVEKLVAEFMLTRKIKMEDFLEKHNLTMKENKLFQELVLLRAMKMIGEVADIRNI